MTQRRVLRSSGGLLRPPPESCRAGRSLNSGLSSVRMLASSIVRVTRFWLVRARDKPKRTSVGGLGKRARIPADSPGGRYCRRSLLLIKANASRPAPVGVLASLRGRAALPRPARLVRCQAGGPAADFGRVSGLRSTG